MTPISLLERNCLQKAKEKLLTKGQDQTEVTEGQNKKEIKRE